MSCIPDMEHGALIVMTGLPDAPTFSNPIPVPAIGPENLDLSVDGDTLLIVASQLSDPMLNPSVLSKWRKVQGTFLAT
jgi:hypothetical protein